MNRLLSALLAATGLLVLVFALTLGDPGEALGRPTGLDAVQASATATADDLVLLEARLSGLRRPCTGDDRPTDRILPDGTRALFVVPLGKAFVLTDMEGDIQQGNSDLVAWSAGEVGVLRATITGPVAEPIEVRARAQIGADAASIGYLTLKVHLQSGVVVDSGASLCIDAMVLRRGGSKTAVVAGGAKLFGYLIPR
jgi:hypothetical protein